jgi:hypothetical protein
MEKLEFLKKMYVEGRTGATFGEEELKFESLDALITENKATIKRMSDIDELDRPTEAKEKPTRPKINHIFDEMDKSLDQLKKEGWKFKFVKYPKYILGDDFDWMFPYRFRKPWF